MARGFVLEIDTVGQLAPTLRKIREAAADLSMPMALASEVMLEGTMARFESESGPDGVPWEKSAAAIEEQRKTLQKSGDLINSVDRVSGELFAAVGIYETGGPAIYARVHQEGATITPKNAKALKTPFGYRASVTIPARPFFGFSDLEVEAIDQILVAHLRRAAGGGAVA